MGWRFRALWRNIRYKGGRVFSRGPRRLRARARHPFAHYVVVGIAFALMVLVLQNPGMLESGWQHLSLTARNGADWAAPAVSRSLLIEPERAVRLVDDTLPRFRAGDHEPAPKMSWTMMIRSWVFTMTGYDFSQPTSFLDVELPGYASVARQNRESLRGPSEAMPPDSMIGQAHPDVPILTLPNHRSDEGSIPPEPTPLPTPGTPNDPEPDQTPVREPEAPQPSDPRPQPTRTEVLAAADWGERPLIAVIHTHPSEMYRTDSFAPSDAHGFHLFDTAETGIIRVGRRLVDTLWEQYGIPAVHDTTLHNTPCHSCAYRESRKTMEELLRRYPSLLVIIDVHRDGAENVSMLSSVGGEDVAQVAVVVGRPNARDLARHPDWTENQFFANRIGGLMQERYPGMFRRVLQLTGVYNQDLHPRSILLEVGNYYDHERHALRTAELLAGILAEALYAERFGFELTLGLPEQALTDQADFIVH